MKTKHTPGPWMKVGSFVDARNENGELTYCGEPGPDGEPERHSIARCFGPNAEANARLIAALPRLLAASQDVAANPAPSGRLKTMNMRLRYDAAMDRLTALLHELGA